MKRVTTLLLAVSLAVPAIAHDCDCDCGKSREQKTASETPDVQQAPAVKEAPAVKVGETVQPALPASHAVVHEEKTEVQDDKTTLQKFLDHPPASDAAKKRMKKR